MAYLRSGKLHCLSEGEAVAKVSVGLFMERPFYLSRSGSVNFASVSQSRNKSDNALQGAEREVLSLWSAG